MAPKSQWLTTEVCPWFILVSLADQLVASATIVIGPILGHSLTKHLLSGALLMVKEKENVAKKVPALNLPGSNRGLPPYFHWSHLNSSLVESKKLPHAQKEREVEYC